MFLSEEGHFETLSASSNGTFHIRYPDGTTETFQNFPNCPYFCKSPIYQLTARTDRNENTTSLNYDAQGRLATITDPHGRAVTFSYNDFDKLATITDPLGRVTRLEYAVAGSQFIRITDPLGQTVSYDYDPVYRVTRKVHKDGSISLYRYFAGQIAAYSQAPGGSPTRLAFVVNSNNWAVDPAALVNQLKQVYLPSTVTNTDSRGNAWVYTYNTNGAITTVSTPDGYTTTRAYDPLTRNPFATTDANNHTTLRQYDARGNLLAETNCLSHGTRYTYEANFNLITSITDPNGFVTTNLYDAHGNRIKETDPLLYTREWTYDSHGNVLAEKDKNGNWTTHAYDSFGNRTNTTDALGFSTTFKYDAVGNLVERTDANLHVSVYAYDALNRLITETNGLAGLPLTPTAETLRIEMRPDGFLQIQWTGPGWTLLQATNLAAPFTPVLVGGQPVTARVLEIQNI